MLFDRTAVLAVLVLCWIIRRFMVQHGFGGGAWGSVSSAASVVGDDVGRDTRFVPVCDSTSRPVMWCPIGYDLTSAAVALRSYQLV